MRRRATKSAWNRRRALGSANSNYNSIVSGAIVDPLSGSSPLRAVPCDVTLDAHRSIPRDGHGEDSGTLSCRLVHGEAEGVRTVTFSAADGGPLPDYLPGQHVTIHIPELCEGGTTRAYSLTGHAIESDRRTYSISVRHQRGRSADGEQFEGVMSSHIHRELAGWTQGLASSPQRHLRRTAGFSKRPVVIFAGGIGITPFISWLETIGELGTQAPESQLFLRESQ